MPMPHRDAIILVNLYIENARDVGGHLVRRFGRSHLAIVVSPGEEPEFVWGEGPVTKAVAINVVQTFGEPLSLR